MSIDPAVVERVLLEARKRLGQREIPGQENQGSIVAEVCRPFLSNGRFADAYNRNILEWCSAFACYCWYLAYPQIRPVVSLEVPVLWDRMSAKGWTWVKEEGAPRPVPGSFIFFVKLTREAKPAIGRNGKPQLRHVELVTAVVEGEGDIQTIGGNTLDQVRERTYHWSDPSVYGFATVQDVT